MKKQIIATDQAPEAIGPYSQAVRAGNMVFTSGQIPIDPKTKSVVSDDIESQTTQVLKNLEAVLNVSGLNFKNVVKTTCYLSNMDNFQAFNAVYASYFTSNPPARATIAVKTLPLNVLVEVDAIAIE